MNSRLISVIIPVFIFAFTFLSQGALYIDDFNRGNSGVYAWSADGRPFADLIYWLFNFGGRAIISYPYTTIISLMFFIFIIYSICEKNKLGILYCIGLTFLIVNPYFSQPMLYKYDSFIMISSISITASCFINHNNKWLILSIPLLLIGIGTYQTALTLYIILSFIELIYTRNLGEKYASALLIKRFFSVIAAVILYKIVLLFCDLSSYTQIHSKTIFSGGGSIDVIYNNFKNFISLLNGATSSFKVSTIVLVLFFISIITIIIDTIFGKKNTYKYLYSILLLACSLGSLVLSFGGISLILLNPVFEPRVMTASYICVFYLIASSRFIFRGRIKLILVGVFSLFSCYVASAVSFAYNEQSKFNNNIYNAITDITDANVIYSSHFNGTPKKSQFVELIESEIPMSKKINFSYFNNDVFSDTYLIYHGVKSYTPNKVFDQDSVHCEKNSENAFIKACVSGNNLFVNFK